MKKLSVIIILTVFASLSSEAQVGKFLKNVKNNVKQDLLGTPETPSQQKTAPEPPSACDAAEMVLDLGKYKIDYSELRINTLDDGSMLAEDRMNGSFFLIKGGTTEGPLKSDDPRIKKLRGESGDDENKSPIFETFRQYISKQGEKYLITFKGKTYGPYAQIDRFSVSRSGEKFAAVVTENIAVTANEGKKMEEAIKKAKTQEEQMQLAMQYSEQIQNNMMAGGGPTSILPKIVSNIPNVSSDNINLLGGYFYSNMKYDDIVYVSTDGITDLAGKKIASFSFTQCEPSNFFISNDNSKTACYNYGTLTFSDGKKLSELFNPHLVKVEGKIWLAYMYFSPKRNAIMLCRIPF